MDCCSSVPYNLEEEPELVDGVKMTLDGMKQQKGDHNLSFTSRAIYSQRGDNNDLRTGSESSSVTDVYSNSHQLITGTHSESSSQELEAMNRTPRELEGMAKVRDIVLNQRSKDSDTSSPSDQSGVNISSRSSSTTDSGSEFRQRERSCSVRETKDSHPVSYHSLPKKSSRAEYDLRSPGLILNKARHSRSVTGVYSDSCRSRSATGVYFSNGRSRSEEPTDKNMIPGMSRPRHHSECADMELRHHSPVMGAYSNSSGLVTGVYSDTVTGGNIRRSSHLSPPAEFRDNNRKSVNDTSSRRKKVVSISEHSDGVRTDDVRRESEIVLKQLYEVVSEISPDKKMSRSNTISFGAETNKSCDETETRRKLNNLSDKSVSSSPRISSSMQAIDRKMNQSESSLVLCQPIRDQDSLTFSCTDWIPHRSVLSDERMKTRISYMFGEDIINFLSHREQFKKMTSFPGCIYR